MSQDSEYCTRRLQVLPLLVAGVLTVEAAGVLRESCFQTLRRQIAQPSSGGTRTLRSTATCTQQLR